MLAIVIWIAGIVASVILTIILRDPIAYAVTRMIGGLGAKRNSLTGVWEARYEYETISGKKEMNQHIFVMRQLGRFVAGKSINTSESPQYIFGKIESGLVFTGTWQGKHAKGKISYHGAFQICIKPTWAEMTGKWVGFNKEMVVMDGIWDWKLKSRDLRQDYLAEQEGMQTKRQMLE